MDNLRAAQRQYDDMHEPYELPDPTEHYMFDEYLERHGMTLGEFCESVTPEQYHEWVRQQHEEFNL